MKRVALLALLVSLPGCGDRDQADLDFGGEAIGPDRFAITTRGDEVKLGLTDEFIYFALSDETRAETREELEAERSDSGDVGGLIGGVLSSAVEKALGFRAKYRVADIRDIRWEDGALKIEFTDPDRELSESIMRVDDRPATEAFAEEDVRAFAEAFRAVKAEAEGRSGAEESTG